MDSSIALRGFVGIVILILAVSLGKLFVQPSSFTCCLYAAWRSRLSRFDATLSS